MLTHWSYVSFAINHTEKNNDEKFEKNPPLQTRTKLITTNIMFSALEQTYRKISNIRRTKSQNLNVSGLVVQLSSPNPMKPGVQSRMKM